MKLSDFFPIVRSSESTRGEASSGDRRGAGGRAAARTVPETFTPAFRSARSSAAAAPRGGAAARVPRERQGRQRRTLLAEEPGLPAGRVAAGIPQGLVADDAAGDAPDAGGPHGPREPRDAAGRERRVAAADEVQRAVHGARARRLADGGHGGVHARGPAQLRERRDGRDELLVRGGDACPCSLDS